MANFIPAGIIKIGRVPFDNSYKHTMTFGSTSAQESYFSSVCTQSLSGNDYTYVRMNNTIRVGFNAERLYTYNYVMYKNANYGNKWFYAFIVGCNYINENCTELVLQLDVIQTWYFELGVREGMVEREHVNTDGIGAYLNAEPPMDLEYKYGTHVDRSLSPQYMVMMVNAFPFYNASQTAVNGSVPVSGGEYHNQYSACKYLVFGMSGNYLAKMKEVMDAYNGAGAAETICDSFTVSSVQLPASDRESFRVKTGSGEAAIPYMWQMKEGTSVPTENISVERPTTIDGYTPKNKKLFSYPYCYVEVGDYSGRSTDYRYEFGSELTKLSFQAKTPCCPDSQVYISPYRYDGATDYHSMEPFTSDISNKVSWVYSAYQNWAAQNGVINQLAVVGSVGAMATSIVPGIGAASRVLGAGASKLGGTAAGKALGTNWQNRAALQAYGSQAAMAGVQNVDYGQAAMGGTGLGALIGTTERMKKVPNKAQGTVGGNSRMQCGYAGYYIAQRYLRREFAIMVDNFFTMYGYQVDRIKKPNINGRPYWNYVKMSNACHVGPIPADDLALINSIYDAGITFWHTSDIGNYSLDNSPS